MGTPTSNTRFSLATASPTEDVDKLLELFAHLITETVLSYIFLMSEFKYLFMFKGYRALFRITQKNNIFLLHRGRLSAPIHQVLVFTCYFKIFFNYSLHSILYCISFRCTAQWLDSHILYKVFPPISKVPTWHHT